MSPYAVFHHTGSRLALHGTQASRRIETAALAKVAAGTLMDRAGLTVMRLARALYPHAREVWLACGPGNNGGDGLTAAAHWAPLANACGVRLHVGWWGDEARLSVDAARALQRARDAGVHWTQHPPPEVDLCIDALLGLGARGPARGDMMEALRTLHGVNAPMLCVDLPSGLDGDSGLWWARELAAPRAVPRHTLSLLTLKPGLFTAEGRDAAGDIWMDDLGAAASREAEPADAWLQASGDGLTQPLRRHASHKGSYGDVVVVGGQLPGPGAQGMVGAALLAARAALAVGAGRVYVQTVGDAGDATLPALAGDAPELMWLPHHAMLADWLNGRTVVCGCGGGAAVAAALPTVLTHAPRLVLDADALNLVAERDDLQQALQARGPDQPTVLTPHPLEAARLLGQYAHVVQADRLASAQSLAQRFGCVVLLKGSGSVIALPGQAPTVNGSGDARLATAGSGDVLAGWIGGLWTQLAADSATPHAPELALQATRAATWAHGRAAQDWPAGQTLRASDLVRRVRY